MAGKAPPVIPYVEDTCSSCRCYRADWNHFIGEPRSRGKCCEGPVTYPKLGTDWCSRHVKKEIK